MLMPPGNPGIESVYQEGFFDGVILVCVWNVAKYMLMIEMTHSASRRRWLNLVSYHTVSYELHFQYVEPHPYS